MASPNKHEMPGFDLSLWPNRLEKAENSIAVDESLDRGLVDVLSDVWTVKGAWTSLLFSSQLMNGCYRKDTKFVVN